MSINARFGMVIEYAEDLANTRGFLVDVLGLQVEREAPNFIQLSDGRGGTFAIANDESLSGTREPEIYWVVDDAEAAFREVSASGDIARPLQALPFGKVFGVRDPNAQTHFVIEFARERPSRPA
ncbi:MAG: VOC family protein [Chloroflexi bacterium]|nr:VOC family protein [Chloroflexota bacterium]